MNAFKKFSKETFSSLSIYNYRLYFIGHGISMSGTWMHTVAQGLLVLQLTGSGTILGIVTALNFLPILLFGPFAGVVIDRYPKRKILYLTQSLNTLLALILGLLVLFHAIEIWMLYCIALAFGFVVAIDNPTRHAFIIELVGKDAIKNAVSLNSSEVNLARIIGPAIGGIFITFFGLAACFLFNAFSYLAVVTMLLFMRTSEIRTSAPTQHVKGQLMEGFHYVKQNPLLKNTLILATIIGLFTFEFTVILPLFAQFTFHDKMNGYTLLISAMGVGAVIGGLFSASRKNATPQLLHLVAFLFGISILVTAIMPSLLLASIAMIFVGFLSINFITLSNTILQTACEPKMRGRVMSLWTVAFLGTTPIGGPLIGWIGEYIGPRWGLAVGGFAAIGASLLGMWMLKNHRGLGVKGLEGLGDRL